MAYVGSAPNPGQNREVDDISSSFNGSTTAFTLQVGGSNVSPGSSNNIIVSLGGVVQNPGNDFSIASSTITFTTAPASGLSFFGIVLGQQIDTQTLADGTSPTVNDLKANTIKGVSATTAAITINSTDGTCSANISNNLSNRNLIINGAMQIDQRGTSSTSTGYQTVDRFAKYEDSGLTEATTQSQVALSSSDTPYSSGHRFAYRITNGNQTSIDANDYVFASHIVEAQNMATSGWNYTSASSNITLSFWVKVSVAQTMYVRFLAADASYQYSFAFSATTSWQKITKTIPGNSNLVFNNDTGSGLQVMWIPYFGTNYTTSGHTNDAWEANDGADQVTDMANTWFSTDNATLDVTGVQIELGSVATDFERKSIGQELKDCQRYCQVVLGATRNDYRSNNAARTGNNMNYFTEMRAAPTATTKTAVHSQNMSSVLYERVQKNGLLFTAVGIATTGGTDGQQLTNEVLLAAEL